MNNPEPRPSTVSNMTSKKLPPRAASQWLKRCVKRALVLGRGNDLLNCSSPVLWALHAAAGVEISRNARKTSR